MFICVLGYVTCILDDAKVYTNHAKKKVIDLDDVKLASQMVLDKAFTAPPPRDVRCFEQETEIVIEMFWIFLCNFQVLLELARGRNIAPLPLIKPHCGLRLPPDRYCLVAANYKLRAAAQNKKITKSAIENRSTIKTQIKSTPTSTIKRPVVSASKSQTVTIPKPVFKFSTTAKTVPAKVRTDVKMETDDPMDDGTSKRKREDDD